jgi:hypothetical protein
MANPILEAQLIEEKEETYDTSDREQINKSKKRSARKRADRLKFIEAAMTLEEGRAWFYDILVFCKVFQGPFCDDPYRTAFLCGEQNIGIRILDDIQTAAPDKYLQMIAENKRNRE